MACSCYQTDIGLVFASLVNTDHRIFNYLINNYDIHKKQFSQELSDKINFIGYLFHKNYCKIDFKERYKRIKKLLDLLFIKNLDEFYNLYFKLLINLNSNIAYKLYQDYPHLEMSLTDRRDRL